MNTNKTLEIQSIQQAIASLKKNHGLTQADIADIVGCTGATISNWKRRGVPIQVMTAAQLLVLSLTLDSSKARSDLYKTKKVELKARRAKVKARAA